jgi:hypothetical protein
MAISGKWLLIINAVFSVWLVFQINTMLYSVPSAISNQRCCYAWANNDVCCRGGKYIDDAGNCEESGYGGLDTVASIWAHRWLSAIAMFLVVITPFHKITTDGETLADAVAIMLLGMSAAGLLGLWCNANAFVWWGVNTYNHPCRYPDTMPTKLLYDLLPYDFFMMAILAGILPVVALVVVFAVVGYGVVRGISIFFRVWCLVPDNELHCGDEPPESTKV